MKIKSVEISNILSVEKASLSFDETGLVLVEGWNYDANRSNGAGKTAIFNAISFALFDKMPRKITASEILRRTAKSGFVSVTFEVGSDTYKITRSRPKGFTCERNGVKLEIGQEEFEKLIKLNYDQFIVSAYCAQGSSTRFIFLNDSDKKTFLLKLLDLDKFQELKKSADDNIKTLTSEIYDFDMKLSSAQSKIDAYQESLIDKAEVTNQISLLESEIKVLNAKLSEYRSVNKPDLSNYVKLEQQISLKEKDIVIAKTTLSMKFNEYKKLSSQIAEFSGSNICKECGTQLDNSSAVEAHNKHQQVIKDQVAVLKNDIADQQSVIAKETEINNLKSKVNEKKLKESEAYSKAQDNINNINVLISKKTSLLDNLALKLSQNDSLLSKINTLKEGASLISHYKGQKVQELEFYKALAAMYSPTGAPAYVLDSVIDSFNDTVSKYIEMVWPSATYTLNSYKENSRGDVVAKFSESLVMDGHEVSIGSLSGGELRALSLCIDFTINDILQNNFGITINPVILDEPFDGLDSAGKEIVIELLAKLANDRCVIVVDHSTEAKALFPKTIMVQKRNGISSISVEA